MWHFATSGVNCHPFWLAVQTSLASGVATAVKPRPNSSNSKKDKQEKSKQEKKIPFSRNEMEE
jgi:hypothetical protein